MGLLYNYTYLNANKYLEKFKTALGDPYLDRATLTKLLKIYDRNHRFKDFIVTNEKGAKCLYNKRMLNDILGVNEIGEPTISPRMNRALRELEGYLRYFYEQDIRNSEPQRYDEPDFSNDEEDMEKVSDMLIQQGNLNEKMENRKGKKIRITESQLEDLKKRINEEYFVEPDKVNIVKKYLDDNFVRGGIPALGEDGYPTVICVVGMKGKDGNVVKNMTAAQMFYLLQDKFNKIYSEPKQRDSFLKKILIDWYDKKIKNGLLSTNKY